MGKRSDLFSDLIEGLGKMNPSQSKDRDYDDYDRDRRRDRHRSAPERDRRRRDGDGRRYDDMFEDYDGRPQRRKSERHRRHYSSDSDSESPPPRRRSERREDRPRASPPGYTSDPYESHPPRNRDRDRDRDRGAGRRHRDEGYASEGANNKYRRDPYDDQYGYERGQLPRKDTERPRRRDDLYDRGDRYRDDRYRDDRYRDSPRGGKKDAPEWQRQAKNMFMDYAMPVIKKEGGKYLARQLGNFGSKR